MRKKDDIPQNTYVYRRVPRQHWKPEGVKEVPKDSAFIDKDESLSVFLADMTTPRQVLQHRIDTYKNDGNVAALERHGATVEDLVKNGWRVVRTPLAVFTRDARLTIRVFDDGTVDPIGHIELCGEVLNFGALIGTSEVISPDDCCTAHPDFSPYVDECD